MIDLVLGIRNALRNWDWLKNHVPLADNVRAITDNGVKQQPAVGGRWIGVQHTGVRPLRPEKGRPFGMMQHDLAVYVFDQNFSSDQAAAVGDANRIAASELALAIAKFVDNVQSPNSLRGQQFDYPNFDLKFTGIEGPAPYDPANLQQGMNVNIFTTRTAIRFWCLRREVKTA